MTTCIFDAVRTPRGRGLPLTHDNAGALAGIAPHELVRQLISALDHRSGGAIPAHTRLLLLSCVGQVGPQGGHIGLVAKLASSLPAASAAHTLNNYCAGGLSAINLGSTWAAAQGDQLVLAGGVEMLSAVPFLADGADLYTKPSVRDALGWLPAPMGSEIMAALEGYTVADLNAVVLRSHRRAAAAWAEGRFARSIVPVTGPDGSVALTEDEWIQPDLTEAQLERLPLIFKDPAVVAGARHVAASHYPALQDWEPTHTPGHAPGFTDGAALVVLGTPAAGAAAGLTPRAELIASAECGGDPILQFGAGFSALEQALQRAGLALGDMDLIEFMEAFPAPPLHLERAHHADSARVNVNGGHLAMGHPMGATGAVLMGTLLDELERRDGEHGLVVTLGANGIGSATVIRRRAH